MFLTLCPCCQPLVHCSSIAELGRQSAHACNIMLANDQQKGFNGVSEGALAFLPAYFKPAVCG